MNLIASTRRCPLADILVEWVPGIAHRVSDAVRGAVVFGETGGGKTTGTFALLLLSMMARGMGGVILTTKPDEYTYVHYLARKAGRERDVVRFCPEGLARFNVLQSEALREGRGGGSVECVVDLVSTLLEVSERDRSGQHHGERYWQDMAVSVLRNAVEISLAATRGVSFDGLYKIVASAPTSLAAAASREFRERSVCCACIREALDKTKGTPNARDVAFAADFFEAVWAGLAEKTRSIVTSVITSTLEPFLRGTMHELFDTTTTVRPEDCWTQRKIIVLDLPIHLFGRVGMLVQVAFKRAFQLAVERRPITADAPAVFLSADECQNFVFAKDAMFQATARSSRTCCVYATQNLPGLEAAYGPESGPAMARALLGNLALKVFHVNSDIATNQYASDLIGKKKELLLNANSSGRASSWAFLGFDSEQSNESAGFGETYEAVVKPHEFGLLKGGGRANEFVTDVILYQAGRIFPATGRPFLKTRIKQILGV